jgi:amino acid adenylation domain-containing protein
MNVSQVSLLHEYLERSAERFPDKAGLIIKEHRYTWRELDDLASRLAHTLIKLGVQRGDRVVIYLDNSMEAAISIFGVLRADAIFSVINPQTKVDKLTYMLNDCRAKVIITDRMLDRIYGEVFPSTPHLQHALIVTGNAPADTTFADGEIAHVRTHSFERLVFRSAKERPPSKNIPTDLAAIIYTSGSTGEPKGVMLTHHNMVSAAESITSYVRNQSDDIVIGLLPMSFDYGLYQWLMVNQFSGTLVLEPSFNYPMAVIKTIEKEKVTGLPVVPTIASILRQYEQKGLKLPNIRYVTNTAAALSLTHIETLRSMCPSARVYSMYGLTECKRVCYLPPEDLDRKPKSVGKAMPNMEVFVLDPDGNPAPPNTVGELVIRGPHVMKGYWEKPDITAQWLKPAKHSLVPGEMWLWSGDNFMTDEDGYLYFIGRKDDIIKTRGEKVSPREVENVLYSMQGVQDVVVVGEEDAVLGQAIRAYLVLVQGTSYTPAQVVKYCSERLEPFMVPKFVTFLSAVPKTSSQKITKKGIREFAVTALVGGDPL